jgi:hypothetical protein
VILKDQRASLGLTKPQGLQAQSASDFSFKNGLSDAVLVLPDSAAFD